jgi:hypothetical protein
MSGRCSFRGLTFSCEVRSRPVFSGRVDLGSLSGDHVRYGLLHATHQAGFNRRSTAFALATIE